ncbi:PspC domain-containing protein [Arthrobacter sp. GMC3]|uniref:PspC domain-containing protein n=1 Tax=Arthrobacter sp. GMC3 TaxID=2058894 RepID=UPI000CE3E312|nr:PspC domain-containing protein [Arthrobacter sp. GMC3]
MNITHDTPEQPAGPTPPPENHSPRPESARFYQWLRGLGVQRGPNRWLGGVCSGLANKWGIDPVIVRGLAVVLTLFFGVGLLAYGVAWALLPEPDGRIHVEEVSHGRWSTGMTGAAIVSFLGLLGPGQGAIWGGHDGWFPWPLFWIAAVGSIIYWAVTRNKSKSPRPVAAPGNPPYAPDSNPGVPYFAASATTKLPYVPQQPYMPVPPPYRKPAVVKVKPRLGAAASLLSLGLAVVVGATVLMLNAATIIDLNGYQVATAAAAAGITAGVAIIVAGIMGRAAGGVGAFAIVALVLAGLLSLPPHSGEFTALNDVTWAPTTLGAAESGRTLVLGNATVDLTQLATSTPLTADVLIPIDTAASSVVIKVPTSVPVRIRSDLAAASMTIDGQKNGGSIADSSTTDINPDAKGYGLVITLQGAASNISVIPVAGK